MAKLTDKQQRFVEEYLIDLNATQAAIRAGYSEKTAHSIGHENLNKPEIQEAIQIAMDERSKRTEITQDMVLAELAKIGFSNISNYLRFNATGVEMFDSDAMKPEALACISEVAETVTSVGSTVKFKLHSKVPALEKIGQHLGMFKSSLDLNTNGLSTFSLNINAPAGDAAN